MEDIKKPKKLLRHASSLVRKGCRIAAIKAGRSEAGSRAASSHTGALANSDFAVSALFKKAGIVRCHGREELAAVGSIFMHKELKGKNIAIITHAGGSAVMLTDILSEGGLCVPHLEGPVADELLIHLHPGSSAANPIDMLATGGVDQLTACIDFIDQRFDNIDGMVVIFGSPGLFSVEAVYQRLADKMKTARKPIFPILPSVLNAREEIQHFLDRGRINFPDEVVFGRALVKAASSGIPAYSDIRPKIDTSAIRKIIDNSGDGYLDPELIQKILDATGIKRVGECYAETLPEVMNAAEELGYPLVMKVVGPVHKSDVGGVVLDVTNPIQVQEEYKRIMSIPQAKGVLIQQQLAGLELYVGSDAEGEFGHLVLFGMGGIFIEVYKDIQIGLVPLGNEEIRGMVKSLNAYPLLQGVRNSKGVNIPEFEDVIRRVSALVSVAPEIIEMDINPLLATSQTVTSVDVRIRIKN